MKKTIIIFAHPNYKDSRINRALLSSIKESENLSIHHIADSMQNLDCEAERKLLESSDRIIFQYPLNWYNMPSIMKSWWDSVFVPGWANLKGEALKGKEIGIVSSAGISNEILQSLGYSLDDVIKPLVLTIKYLKAEYIGSVLIDNAPNVDDKALEKFIREYHQLIA